MALPVIMPNTSSAGVENTWPGADGGTIQALAIDPAFNTTLYAGTEFGGVYKSTAGGSTWVAVNNGLTNLNVQLLRGFRDRFLLKNGLGRSFVNLYYTYSAPIAKFIAGNGVARLIVRWGLLPVVGLSWMALNVNLGATIALVFLLLAVASVATVVLAKRVRLR
jgi:hypothetical protein